MAREAVVDTATGSLKRYGREGFATSDDFDGGSESVVALNDSTDRTPGTELKHHKVVAGVITVMTGPEQATVDATIPTIQTPNPQFVKETRAPTTADDATLGFFNGARWLRTDTDELWWLKDNTGGAAVWVPTIADAGPLVMEYIFARHTSTVTHTGSPTLVPFNTTVSSSTSPPFTHNGSGTFTCQRDGKFMFDAAAVQQMTSGQGTSELQIYIDTGGGYVVLPAETSSSASQMRIESVHGDAVVHAFRLRCGVAVSDGDGIRLYVTRTVGSGATQLWSNYSSFCIREMKE